MRALLAILALSLAACATALAPPAGTRTWRGPEGDVIPAILSDVNAPEVVTILFGNGNYFVATDLRFSAQPNGYCVRGLAENHPDATQGRWRDYDPGGDGLACMLFRGVVTVWEGDARDWPAR